MTDTEERTTQSNDAVEAVNDWLAENWDPDLTVAEWWERLGLSGWAAPGLPEHAYGKGLNRNDAVAVQNAIARVRRPRGARRARPAARGAHDRGARHAGADRPLRAGHRHRPEGVVPALQRARRRLRPRRPADQGDQGRRRVDRHRPEGVDLRRPGGRHGHAHRPHRPQRPQAPGHHLLRHRHAPEGHRDPAPGGDDRARHVQRGLHGGGDRPRRRPHRRPQQRLGRGEHHPHERAGRARLRWRPRRRRRGDPGHHRQRPREASGRLRVLRWRAAASGRRRGRHVRRLLQAPRRARQGQRQDRRPVDPPGPHEAPHAQRARAA